MPRNGSGVFSLPAGTDDFVAGTTIESGKVDSLSADIAADLNNITNGTNWFTGPLKAADGTVLLPGITFNSDPDVGFYRIAANRIGVTVGGVKAAEFASTYFVPGVNDTYALGIPGTAWSDAAFASGALIDFGNGNMVLTHSSGVLTASTGDIRVTTAGTNTASAVTVGGTQTLTNKALQDSTTTIVDNLDATKALALQVSGIATATTRTWTVQDVSGTVYVSGGTDIPVPDGGTGASTLTGLLQGNGTGAITGGATINDANWSGTDLSVANGGTGASTLTGLLSGNGTGAITGSTTINNANWSGTDLAVANGGTGASTETLARAAFGIQYQINNQSVDYTVVAADRGKIISMAAAAKTITMTASTLGSDFIVGISVTSAANAVTLDDAASATNFFGPGYASAASVTVNAPRIIRWWWSDSTNWREVASSALDINTLTADATPDPAADYVATWDASAATFKKVLLGDMTLTGSWTPTLTAAVPGNLVVAYTTRYGGYRKVGKAVSLDFVIVTSTFTFTTATGNLQITGMPFAPQTVTDYASGAALESWRGFNSGGGFTQVAARVSSGSSIITFFGNPGALGASAPVDIELYFLSPNTVHIRGTINYTAAS